MHIILAAISDSIFVRVDRARIYVIVIAVPRQREEQHVIAWFVDSRAIFLSLTRTHAAYFLVISAGRTIRSSFRSEELTATLYIMAGVERESHPTHRLSLSLSFARSLVLSSFISLLLFAFLSSHNSPQPLVAFILFHPFSLPFIFSLLPYAYFSPSYSSPLSLSLL